MGDLGQRRQRRDENAVVAGSAARQVAQVFLGKNSEVSIGCAAYELL
jgi:hypothetical protein